MLGYMEGYIWIMLPRSPRISPSAISMSPSETSVLDQADPLREEDSDLFPAMATPSKRSPGSVASPAAVSTSVAAAIPAAPASDREAAADTPASIAAAGAAEALPDEPASTSGISHMNQGADVCHRMQCPSKHIWRS